MIDISKYINLITLFHRQRPKFISTIEASLQPIIDARNFIETIPSHFDIDTAIGVQLDVVGQWVNLSRNIKLPLPDPWFRWGDDGRRGWGRGLWIQPYDSGFFITALDDETYRRLLKARIEANSWDGTTESALEILNSFFNYTIPGQFQPDDFTKPILIVDDKSTMEIIFALSGVIPDSLNLEIFGGNYLPFNTAGVRSYHLVTSVNYSPIFGWGLDNESVGGWGTGAWGVPPSYLIENPPSP